MTYEDYDDRAYEARVDMACDEQCRNRQVLISMGFSRKGGFTRPDYPVYAKGGGTVIFAHHQATNYVYAEGKEAIGAIARFRHSHTKRAHSLSELLSGLCDGIGE